MRHCPTPRSAILRCGGLPVRLNVHAVPSAMRERFHHFGKSPGVEYGTRRKHKRRLDSDLAICCHFGGLRGGNRAHAEALAPLGKDSFNHSTGLPARETLI